MVNCRPASPTTDRYRQDGYGSTSSSARKSRSVVEISGGRYVARRSRRVRSVERGSLGCRRAVPHAESAEVHTEFFGEKFANDTVTMTAPIIADRWQRAARHSRPAVAGDVDVRRDVADKKGLFAGAGLDWSAKGGESRRRRRGQRRQLRHEVRLAVPHRLPSAVAGVRCRAAAAAATTAAAAGTGAHTHRGRAVQPVHG